MRSLMRRGAALKIIAMRRRPRRNSAVIADQGITAAAAGEQAVAADARSELNNQALWVESTLTGRGRLCSVRTCHSCCCGLPHQSLMALMFGISSHMRSRVSGG